MDRTNKKMKIGSRHKTAHTLDKIKCVEDQGESACVKTSRFLFNILLK